MKLKNIIVYFLGIVMAISVSGCSGNEVADNSADEAVDYSKYIGTYSFVSEEGTRYESSETLTITNIDGNIIDFEYEYQPPRHTIEFTAEQGIFTDAYTALADGAYSFDGQPEEIVTYEFKLKEDAIDFKWYLLGEDVNGEYTTFYLNEKDDAQDNQNNVESDTSDDVILMTDTSTGVDNPYTELMKGGTGRQFTMTIDEFVEKYNQKLNDREAAKIETETEEYVTDFYGEERGHYSYPLDMEQVAAEEIEMYGERVTKYQFNNVSKLDGEINAYLNVFCYSDTNKVFLVYCQVSDEWYQNDNERYVRKIKQPQSSDDYVNLPLHFNSFANDVFGCINPNVGKESNDVHDIIDEVGSDNINYKDGVKYRYYDCTINDGKMCHGLIMYASTKEFTGVPIITINY